ncbi:uncharacterized protein Z518_04930 [Rhinocladiella mackenziei CBS 650.93]|uniref:Phenol 2-monooxygenase n=1 Tax=Rhinocladiella mackenziei CBS 650.93 TaxID=1442369 RepID=A0A0D2IMH6_9EURO|nr:uncharacterized protein Z518_04930 [Rhinocladiella mackenziei CBS 650.93]KIX06954.1 hypothetical protein Z518_04930 [Rhinocladiella mackenziei CBS 650.93]
MLAASYGLKTRIIDKRPTKLLAGHGDGLHARGMELMASFGLASKIMDTNVEFNASQIWNGLMHVQQVGDMEMPSHYRTQALSQARISDLMLDFIHQASTIQVERGQRTEADSANDIHLDDDEAILSESQKAGASSETIQAKYIIGCDGAHSWTRKEVGINMTAEDTDVFWGILDVIPNTDFPMPRFINVVTTGKGGLFWIPRENGMVRVYTALAALKPEAGQQFRSRVTPEYILKQVQEQLAPYKFTYTYCAWWVVYQIGRSIARQNTVDNRIFLAGDAVHTHSPHAGQGMMASMLDAHNLVWKLALVTKGLADPDKILPTYEAERLGAGQALVDFDRKYAATMTGSTLPESFSESATTEVQAPKLHQAAFLVFHNLQLINPPGILTRTTLDAIAQAKKSINEGQLPPGVVTGMRMPSHQVRDHFRSHLVWFGDRFRSGGRFRVIVFAGDLPQATAMTRYRDLGSNLSRLTKKYAPTTLSGTRNDSVIAPLTLHTANPRTLNYTDLPAVFTSCDETLGYVYDTLYYDGAGNDKHDPPAGSAYSAYNVDPVQGRLVIVRPDGYVGYQGPVEAWEPAEEYFSGFLLPAH